MYYGKLLRLIAERLAEIGKKLDEQKNAQCDARKTAEQKWSEVPAVIASNILGTADEKKSADAYRKEVFNQQERLIASQDNLVYWTRFAFFAAAIYAGIAVFQLDQMKIATDAARCAADTAAKQLDLSQKQFRISQGAYIVVQPQVGAQPDGSWKPTILIANDGRDSALDVRGELVFAVKTIQNQNTIGQPLKVPVLAPYPIRGSENPGSSNWLDRSGSFNPTNIFPYTVPASALKRIMAVEAFLELSGFITYENGIDPKPETDQICFRVIYNQTSNFDMFPCQMYDLALSEALQAKHNLEADQGSQRK